MNFPTLQETFDTIVSVPAATEALYFDMDRVVEKHINDIKSVGFTDSYYDDVAKVAEKYGLSFQHPKYAKGVTMVASRPTLH